MGFETALTAFCGALMPCLSRTSRPRAQLAHPAVKLVGPVRPATRIPTSGPFGAEPSIGPIRSPRLRPEAPSAFPSGASGSLTAPASGSPATTDDVLAGKYICSYLCGGDGRFDRPRTPRRRTPFSNAGPGGGGDEIFQKQRLRHRRSPGSGSSRSGNCTTITAARPDASDDRPWRPDMTPRAATVLPEHNHYTAVVSAQPIAVPLEYRRADNFANPLRPLVTDPTIEANVPQ